MCMLLLVHICLSIHTPLIHFIVYSSVSVLFVVQMIQSLQIILVDKKSLLTEDSIINMLHFISAMPVTIGGRMGENLCAMTVLPYVSQYILVM